MIFLLEPSYCLHIYILSIFYISPSIHLNCQCFDHHTTDRPLYRPHKFIHTASNFYQVHILLTHRMFLFELHTSILFPHNQKHISTYHHLNIFCLLLYYNCHNHLYLDQNNSNKRDSMVNIIYSIFHNIFQAHKYTLTPLI